MATAKSNRYFDGFSLRYLLLHPAVWFIAATCLVVFASIALWEQHRDQIVDPGQFSIAADAVQINPPPDAFKADLTEDLYDRVLSNASLSNRDLVPLTAEYLGSVPWVRKINRIEKSSGGLEIDLSYRIPVALVEVANRIAAAVDADGTVFDLSLLIPMHEIAQQPDLLRISMPQINLAKSSLHRLTASDLRIQHASRLCEFLLPVSKELELIRVVTYDLPNRKPDSRPPQLELWTRNGTRVVWGSSPGHELAHESNPQVKLSVLQEFISSSGSLSDFSMREESKIDVSTGTLEIVAAKRVASLFELLEQCK